MIHNNKASIDFDILRDKMLYSELAKAIHWCLCNNFSFGMLFNRSHIHTVEYRFSLLLKLENKRHCFRNGVTKANQ